MPNIDSNLILNRRGGGGRPAAPSPSSASKTLPPTSVSSQTAAATDSAYYPPPNTEIAGLPIWAFLTIIAAAVVVVAIILFVLARVRQKRRLREKEIGADDASTNCSSVSYPSPTSSCETVPQRIRRSQMAQVTPSIVTGRRLSGRPVSPTSTVPPSPSSESQFLVNHQFGTIRSVRSIHSVSDSGSLVRHHSLNRPAQFNTLDRRTSLPASASSSSPARHTQDMFEDDRRSTSSRGGKDGVVFFDGPPQVIPPRTVTDTSSLTSTASSDSGQVLAHFRSLGLTPSSAAYSSEYGGRYGAGKL
ncbi:hypothetical protein HDU67_002872 [Dinochytrium kinnereticum]|nr:hypothetical protein HDU67_002872 [Dinochytrium kinnereticum]